MFYRQLDWKEFVNQPQIKKLTLNEQMYQYNFHLQKMSNYNFQPKGPGPASSSSASSQGAAVAGIPFDLSYTAILAGPVYNYARWNYRIVSSVANINAQPTMHLPQNAEVQALTGTVAAETGDNVTLTISRFSPDDTPESNGTIVITPSGNYLSVINPTGKSLNYSFSLSEIVDGGVDWTWTFTNVDSDFSLRVFVTEE